MTYYSTTAAVHSDDATITLKTFTDGIFSSFTDILRNTTLTNASKLVYEKTGENLELEIKIIGEKKI